MTPERRKQPGLPLREAIQQQLAKEELDPLQLQALMNTQQAVLTGSADPQLGRRYWSRAALIASCAALLLCLALAWQSLIPSPGDTTHTIALEVVKNHLKLKPLDVEAQSMDELQAFFTQLDFAPVDSTVLETRFGLSRQLRLGGRYCSIKGVTAAQLRYRAGEGTSTLYEVAYDPATFGSIPSVERGEAPSELLVKGLRVSLWVEKGLLMVLVEAA